MTNGELQNVISGWMEGLIFQSEGKQYLTITVPKENIRELMLKLKNDENTVFDFLFSLTAVDYFPANFGVIYHLESTKLRHMVAVICYTADRENDISIDSISDIFPTANFHEREAYDLMGIIFNGHPDLRRLFMTEDWVGHPLRKDYTDETNLIIR
ncbi:MAG: NADH-quinone oxidoreductase subunit C [Deltaproteobacteria bacterium]